MKQWVIEGGEPLHGSVAVAGAKNVVVKLMIAALLAEDETTLENVPEVGDVETVGEMIALLGGKVERLSPHSIRIYPQEINAMSLPRDLAQKSRASTMFAGPLLARLGEALLPLPGGDRIGRRPLNWHFEGLQTMNVEIRETEDMMSFRTVGLKGCRFRFPKNSHIGTETLILTAVLAEGETVLENAAQEPEIDDLIGMLNGMGAKIQRTAARTIVIAGVPRLRGTTHHIMSDRNEQVSFSCMALATKGDIRILRAQPQYLESFLLCAKQMAAGIEVEGESIRVWHHARGLQPVYIDTGPHPGFMTDWQPLVTTLLTQAKGESVVHETVFEHRFDYVADLIQMGAKISFFNPDVPNLDAIYNFNWRECSAQDFHAARVFGPTDLHGIDVTVTDVRAGASLVQAALMANGRTTLSGVEHIERGYERLVERLRSLGAKIERSA